MSEKLEHLWVKHLDFTPLNGFFFSNIYLHGFYT